jgi:hypothetical protein
MVKKGSGIFDLEVASPPGDSNSCQFLKKEGVHSHPDEVYPRATILLSSIYPFSSFLEMFYPLIRPQFLSKLVEILQFCYRFFFRL